MEGEQGTYRVGRDVVLVDELGIELRRAGHAPVRLPWAAIGLLREETDGGRGARVLRAHLLDGRKLDLPLPPDAAAILRAWRRSYATRGPNPHDAVPVDFRRASARQVDLSDIADAVPDGVAQDDVSAYQERDFRRRWAQRLRRLRG